MIGVAIAVVKNLFPTASSDMDNAEATVVNWAIAQTVRNARPWTPVDTGFLVGSTVPTLATPGNPNGRLDWTTDYAGFVHEGTVNMAGFPFARVAVDMITAAQLASQFRIAGGR